MFEENTKPPISLDPLLCFINDKIQVTFVRGCLKQEKIRYTHYTLYLLWDKFMTI